ncbi:YggS family pyridoxal phosphate enzyme [Clostridia bacterium]|nr:YggS family pyridoxal phosphate enzyme [Clostridia bacterium]
MEYIKENLREVRENIANAAKRAGRDPNEITLVAVSKTFPAEFVTAAAEQGVNDFGENKVSELIAKQDAVQSGVKWHLIGHLQTNKVKKVIGKTCLIHSLDSFRLAEEINRVSSAQNIVTSCLIEINIAEEPQKYGVSPKDAENFAAECARLSNVRIKGLMCVAPAAQIGELNRKYFAQMRKIFVDIKAKNVDNVDMTFLSFGMSGDYECAVEEGANIVRVGSAVFGRRNYQKE